MSTIELACAAEGNYAAHSAAMLLSALDHRGGREVRVHYLHPPEFPRRGRHRLMTMIGRQGAEASFVEVPDATCAGLPVQGFTRKATWYRILLPELLPDLGRVLFLDCDMIVTDSLAPLWETDLGDDLVAAVTNVFQHDHLGRLEQIGLDDPGGYFNAGVLLLDLDTIRREGRDGMRQYALANLSRLEWRDQDTLNLVLGDRRLPLHPRWNLMNSMLLFPNAAEVLGGRELAEARANPAIRHFEGPADNKPWHLLCEREMRGLYREYRRRTPWPRQRPEGLTPRNLILLAARRLRR